MKARTRFILLGLVAAALAFLWSCSGLTSPVSIEERITEFVTSLNGDRTDTYTNLDPSTAAYGATKDAAWWDAPFATADEPFSFSPDPPVTTDPTDVEVTISGGGIGKLYKFVMVNTGTITDDWVINDIQLSTGAGTWSSIFSAP